MVKVKVKLLVIEKSCPLNISWPLCLKIAKSGPVDALREWMFPIDVQVTWSMVKVKLFVLILSAVNSIFYDPLISIDIKKVK